MLHLEDALRNSSSTLLTPNFDLPSTVLEEQLRSIYHDVDPMVNTLESSLGHLLEEAEGIQVGDSVYL